MVYVMVGYRYIFREWILFWAYMLWNTTIVLPSSSRPDMQKKLSHYVMEMRPKLDVEPQKK